MGDGARVSQLKSDGSPVGCGGGVVPPEGGVTLIAATDGWSTFAVNAMSSRPSVTGTEKVRVVAVIAPTAAKMSKSTSSTGPPSKLALNTRFPAPPGPPPVAPWYSSAKCSVTENVPDAETVIE